MHIHNIDFHYHAGNERQTGKSLLDYLEHARMTGRRVLGLTDHLQFFFSEHEMSPERAARMPYARSLDGLEKYRNDMEELRDSFDGMEFYFGPEIPTKTVLTDVPERVLELSDYFICEHRFNGGESIQENTDEMVRRIEEIGRFVADTGKPTFVAHPFRLSVNYRMTKRDIEPWLTAIEPRPDYAWLSADERAKVYSPEQVNEFFVLDVRAIGEASKRTGVPLEINGNTHKRVCSSNLPAALQIYWRAYEILKQQGARFVPGSDQHGFMSGSSRTGGYVPWDTFALLGIEAKDIGFVEEVRRSAVRLIKAHPAGMKPVS